MQSSRKQLLTRASELSFQPAVSISKNTVTGIETRTTKSGRLETAGFTSAPFSGRLSIGAIQLYEDRRSHLAVSYFQARY
jgi:hypothetical protein